VSSEKRKTCKICDEQIAENSFARNSTYRYYFHVTCLVKLELLLKIKNSNSLNREDFKMLQILLEVLYKDIPIDLISDLEEKLNANLPVELGKKGVIEKFIKTLKKGYEDHFLIESLDKFGRYKFAYQSLQDWFIKELKELKIELEKCD